MEKYRAEMSHLIEGKQVNKPRIFWAATREEAKEKFQDLRKADKTIQEAGLFCVKDNSLVDEYIGYI
mgnify:CR=1 FL=1